MLLPVDGYSVGEHPNIARLLKGMFHIRPLSQGIVLAGMLMFC